MSRNTENNTTKYVDILDEDKAVAGQKYVCLSFISPEKILKQKEMFFFENYLKHFDFHQSMMKFQQFLNFMSYKYNLNFDKINSDYEDFIKSERENLEKTNIVDDYKNYLDAKEDDLEKEFNQQVNFQTNVRGIKVRGSYPTQEEAELRCKLLREVDPYHDIYVGPVGVWMPFEPEAYKTGRVEYLEKELNQLMHEKRKNEEKAKIEFENRVKETKKKAIQENIKKAEKSGNKLTQNIDEEGNLIGVDGGSTLEKTLNQSNEVISSADIKKELFEGDDIILKNDKKQ